jgi:hypothetical protein
MKQTPKSEPPPPSPFKRNAPPESKTVEPGTQTTDSSPLMGDRSIDRYHVASQALEIFEKEHAAELLHLKEEFNAARHGVFAMVNAAVIHEPTVFETEFDGEKFYYLVDPNNTEIRLVKFEGRGLITKEAE